VLGGVPRPVEHQAVGAGREQVRGASWASPVASSTPGPAYIGGNNWEWATKGNPYKTATAAQTGFQARYLVWDATTGEYVSVARSEPWKG
jgi:hypothetical protein